jgi:regulatory protein YycH of two-component signal transduction system YycFG
MKTKQINSFIVNILIIISVVIIYAILSDWGNFKAGLFGLAPM